ncbi:ATP-binding protein [Corynebacterium sp. HMSC074A01]|uniref:ATP-binding protein n=1 Tax=Corynebacterium sp. HMSC074A01 TaxID=1715030 RepID=UPI0008A337AC|nr:ATP-binding protein [Corynebacterium sp. HMSC074A01]OHF35740.1 ATP-binding protein [Corynebacterium sp. HMSC074A01]
MTPIPGQFRLNRIQVYNWGTFDGLHTIDIAREGYLVWGPSGSGKSTLIDAISAILVPPSKRSFNAAADSQKRSDRTMITYCRGAWRREHSEELDELTRSYLRPGAIWSGVMLRYDNALGQTISACRLMFLSANAYTDQDVTDLYLLLPADSDLTQFEPLAVKNLPVKKAKHDFPDALYVGRKHPQFIHALQRALGIADSGALELLHRTQSAKTLGDLNHLMRTFMLPEPETFRVAKQAAENFTALRDCYTAVVNAREQIEHLVPIRETAQAREEIARATAVVTEEQTWLDPFIFGSKVKFAQRACEQHSTELAALSGTILAGEAEVETLRREREELRQLIDGKQDTGLAKAEMTRDHRRERLMQVEAAAEAYAKRLQVLELAPPGTAEEFAYLSRQLGRDLQNLRAQQEAEDEKYTKAIQQVGKLQEAEKACRTELQTLHKYSSAMDSRLLRARAKIADAAGIREKELPFVADLISVKEGEGTWQGAAERVMGGFARTLLVPEEHYRAVSTAIDATHLGAKLQYTRIKPEQELAAPPRFQTGTLGTKIDVAGGRFYNWVQSQLSRKFDHQCCESMEDFRRARRAVTRNGQVKHSETDHVKDDRRRIDDKSTWVLWGNLDDKIDSLHVELQRVGKELQASEQARDTAKRRMHTAQKQIATAERLQETADFSAIDTVTATRLLAEAQELVDQLTDGNAELAELKKQFNVREKRLRDAQGQLNGLIEQRGRVQQRLEHAEQALTEAQARLERGAPPEEVRTRLADRAGEVTEENIDRVHEKLRKAITAELDEFNRRDIDYASQMLDAMRRFLHKWEHRKGDLQAEAGYQHAFLMELDRLETENLPKSEQRFKEMLEEQTHTHFGRLRRLIRDAAANTRESIKTINESLAQVEFYPDTHLQIEVREAQPQIARAFIELIDASLDGMINEADLEDSERRFHKIREVIEAITISDTTTAREQKLRLDTRQHVKFLGVEYGTDRVRGAVYDSAEGLSGGQAQKLSSFCLAAALRYRLTGMGTTASQAHASVVQVDDAMYPRFGTIVLDEAFDRADAEFTRAAMEAFRRFGFHMILATPEKLLQTVEDHIGGVLMVECPDRKHSQTSTLTIEEAFDEGL